MIKIEARLGANLPKSKNEVKIVIFYTFCEEHFRHDTGLLIHPNKWNSSNQSVVSTDINSQGLTASRINSIIDSLVTKIYLLATDLINSSIDPHPKVVQNALNLGLDSFSPASIVQGLNNLSYKVSEVKEQLASLHLREEPISTKRTNRFLSIADFIKEVGISRSHYYTLVRSGKISTTTKMGRTYIPIEMIDQYFKSDSK